MHIKDAPWITKSLGVFAIFFVLSAMLGGFLKYSPVPYLDMWDGYINFYLNIQDGQWSAWWARHNEHIIFLSRLLFLLDIYFFKGTISFLIICHYLIVLATAMLLCVLLRQQIPEPKHRITRFNLQFIIFIITFSWLQKDNFSIGFQSQFFLAQLLPLSSFVLLGSSHQSAAHSLKLFVLACFIGILAIGSMANGILTLPLMTILACYLRLPKGRTLVLCALSIITILFYVQSASSSSHHSSPLHTFMQFPIQTVLFALCYLGNPIYHMLGKGDSLLPLIFSAVAGFMLLMGAFIAFIQQYKSGSQDALKSSFIVFIAYIGITALGTAGGRLSFGLHEAFTNRYTTPSLLAWATLLILYAQKLTLVPLAYTRWLLTIPLLLLAPQIEALKSRPNVRFQQEVAALALELHIKDNAQISKIYPVADIEHLMQIASTAAARHISVFNQSPIADSRLKIGSSESRQPAVNCVGQISAITQLDNNTRFLKISGHISPKNGNNMPSSIHFVSHNNIIGVALVQQHSPFPVAKNTETTVSGDFSGYVSTSFDRQRDDLIGLDPDCKVSLQANQ